MNNWTWVVFSFFLFAVGACGGDDNFCVDTDFDSPEWKEDVVFTGTTNLPQVQIDRFVEANSLDTVQTPSGLVYSILSPGSSEKPESNSSVLTWYKGYLTDGQIFDQSNVCNRGPSRFSLDGVIQAWTEGIPKLGVGGKMILLARPNLAYGNRPPNAPITSSTVLVFEIELLEIE